MARTRLLTALVLMAMVSTLGAQALEPTLPEQAMAPDTTFVMWSDLSKWNAADANKAMEAIIAVAPEAEQARMRAEMLEGADTLAARMAVSGKLLDAGVLAVVLAVASPEAEGAEPTAQLFLHTKPDTDPLPAVKDAARELAAWAREQDQAQGKVPSAEEFEAQLATLSTVKVNAQWHAVLIEDEPELVGPTADDALDPAPYVAALALEQGAVVSFAWLMTDDLEAELAEAMASPDAAMMAGLLGPLQNMISASGGVWLGDDPKMKFSMTFADEDSASQFKTSVDGMVQMFGGIIAMSATQPKPDGSPSDVDPAAVQAVLAQMGLEQDGAVVSKSFDTAMLKQFTEAGIPWAQGNTPAPGNTPGNTPENGPGSDLESAPATTSDSGSGSDSGM